MIDKTHTPGPWSLGRAGNANVIRFDMDNITAVASVPNIANAHLIAAAPELLAALKAAQDFVSLALGCVDFPAEAPGRFEECANALNAIVQAIAKAEQGLP